MSDRSVNAAVSLTKSPLSYKPPLPGSGVVITDKKGAVRIKEFVRQKQGGIVVREYRPKLRDFAIAEADIESIHAVVGAAEP